MQKRKKPNAKRPKNDATRKGALRKRKSVKKKQDLPKSDYFPYQISKHGDVAWQENRFKRLTKKFSDDDCAAFRRAYDFAKERHLGQKRAGGSPYTIHLVRISNILAGEWNETSANVIVAAILHDIVEDTTTTIREVKDAFGSDVGKLVDGITRWKGSESPEVYLRRIARSPVELQRIKCADILDNLRSWFECPEDVYEKFPHWWKQAHEYALPMSRRACPPAASNIAAMVEDEWYLLRANMI